MKKSIFSNLRVIALTFGCLFLAMTNMSLAEKYSKTTADKTDETRQDVEQDIKATAITHSFPGVTTFMTSAGRLGFFEQGTGKIYIYDSDFENCVFKGQLNKLGEPIVQNND